MPRAKSTSRRAERRDQRRQDILEVANRLFSAHGYENVTLRAVAEELGYTHATLYRYFPDKAHLLDEVCQRAFALLAAEIDALTAARADPVERLFQTSRGLVRFCRAYPQHFRTVFFGPESRGGTHVGLYIDRVGKLLFERLIRVFNDAAQGCGHTGAALKLAEQTWWSAVIGLALVLIIQGEVPHMSAPDRVVEQLLTTMWTGLQTSASNVKALRPAAKSRAKNAHRK